MRRDYETAYIDTIVSHWETKLIDAQINVDNIFISLRNMIGAELSSKPIPLTDSFIEPIEQLPDLAAVLEYAKAHNPSVKSVERRIEQARHQQSLEKSNILTGVTAGIGYIKNADSTNQWGPYFNIELPVFDVQQNQIEKAKLAEARAKHELVNVQSSLEETVKTTYNSLRSSLVKINLLRNATLPSSETALEVSHQKRDTFMISPLLFMQTQIALHEQRLLFNREMFSCCQLRSALAQALGALFLHKLQKTAVLLCLEDTILYLLF